MKMTTFLRVFMIYIILDDCVCYEITKHVAVQQYNYENFIINDVTAAPLVTTRVACVQKCVTEVTCLSVFYHMTTQTCHRVPMGYTTNPTNAAVPVAGWSYYIVLEERCPRYSGYVYSKEFRSCYRLHDYDPSLTIAQYNQVCQDEGGELMKIDSEAKFQHIAEYLGQFTAFGASYITIQGRHVMTETNWYYNDGTTMTYFKWAPLQPDDTTVESYETLALSVADGFMMHDVWTPYKGPFLCEKNI